MKEAVTFLLAALPLAACSSPAHGGAPGQAASGGPGPGPTRVTTDHGDVQGVALASTRAFLGIPYAQPPVGDLRWAPPADADAWTNVRDASAFGAPCAGYNLLTSLPDDRTSEDCLTLNVWAPLDATSNAPVMVFFYGGSFVSGTGSDPAYDGANLAAAAGAIVVTINYRLGPFGFLDYPAVTGTGSANLGLLDQRAALAWIGHNAGAFGGDPADVTVFGESAGAISVCAHLAMPGSAGLFARAIVESGTCDGAVFFTPQAAGAQSTALAKTLGCDGRPDAAACLRGVAQHDVLAALPLSPSGFGPGGASWGPVYGDPELPELPLSALVAGTFAHVPLLLGTNAHEGQLFTALAAPVTDASARAIVASLFGAGNVDAILARYPASAYPSTDLELADVITDGVFACPTRRAARAVTAAGANAFLYQFTYPFQVALLPGVTAAHGYELPFVFGNDFYGTHLDAADEQMVGAVQGYWSRFAAAGDPNGSGANAWPAYAAATDENAVLASPVATASGTKSAACDFWDGVHP